MIGIFRRRRKEGEGDDPAWKPVPWWKKVLKFFLSLSFISAGLVLVVILLLELKNSKEENALLQQWEASIGGVDLDSIERDFPSTKQNQKTTELMSMVEDFDVYLAANSRPATWGPSNLGWLATDHYDLLRTFVEKGDVPSPEQLEKFSDWEKKNSDIILKLLDLGEGNGPFLFDRDNSNEKIMNPEMEVFGAIYVVRLLWHVVMSAHHKGDLEQLEKALDLWWSFCASLSNEKDFWSLHVSRLGIRWHFSVTRSFSNAPEKWLTRYETLSLQTPFKDSIRYQTFSYKGFRRNNDYVFQGWNPKSITGWVAIKSGFKDPWVHKLENRALKLDLESLQAIDEFFPCFSPYEKLNSHRFKEMEVARDFLWVGDGAKAYSRTQRHQYDLDLTLTILSARVALAKNPAYWPANQNELDDFVFRSKLPLSLSCDEDQFAYTLTDEGVHISIEGPLNIYRSKKAPNLPLEYTIKKPQETPTQ